MDELVNNIAIETESLAGQLIPFAKARLETAFPGVKFDVTEKYVKAVIGDKVRWIMFDLGKPLFAA